MGSPRIKQSAFFSSYGNKKENVKLKIMSKKGTQEFLILTNQQSPLLGE
jgi:hypothetical protein